MEENIFRIGLSTKLSQCIKELRCLDGLGNIKDVQQLEIISEKKVRCIKCNISDKVWQNQSQLFLPYRSLRAHVGL